MQPIILIIHVIAAIGVISLVLLQHGKGADAGASFGSGASNTMFGSTGSLPFLMKVTAILAVIFFVTSMTLSYMVAKAQKSKAGMMSVPAVQQSVKQPATSVMDIPSVNTPVSGSSQDDKK